VNSKAEWDQLDLAHVARKKYEKEKTYKRHCLPSLVQVKIGEGSSEGIRKTMEERICERDVLSLE